MLFTVDGIISKKTKLKTHLMTHLIHTKERSWTVESPPAVGEGLLNRLVKWLT